MTQIVKLQNKKNTIIILLSNIDKLQKLRKIVNKIPFIKNKVFVEPKIKSIYAPTVYDQLSKRIKNIKYLDNDYKVIKISKNCLLNWFVSML